VSINSCKLLILISGNGSNLQSFIDQCQSGEFPASICAVISNRPGAFGLKRAEKANIATRTIDHSLFDSRADFDQQLIEAIDEYSPDLVVLAGFMRILTPGFVKHYHGRLLNIHPSLLPKYPGLNTHQRAIDAGDCEAGATVHFVTEELDGGPAVIQAAVPVMTSDDADSLAIRIVEFEHKIYPESAKWFAQGRLKLEDNQAVLDGRVLAATGFIYSE
jgi:phosphoribosylglycinamide formyltransferase-1